MAQATVFPIRFGLQLPQPENIKAVEVFSEGGLDLTQSIIENRPGCASALVNFEASLTGGYRRINGYALFSSTVVPGQGALLGVFVAWPNMVLAARQDIGDPTKYNIFKGSGTTWTQLNPSTTTASGTTNGTTTLNVVTTGLIPGQPISGSTIAVGTYIISITDGSHLVMSAVATGSTTATMTFSNPLKYTSGMFLSSCFYDWSGPVRTTVTDGVNFPYRWDAINGFVMLIGTAAVPAPVAQWCSEFQDYLFLGGLASNAGAIALSAPNADFDYTPADGAGIAVVGDVVTGLKVWRNQLIVFCDKSINKVIPNTLNTTGITPPPAFQVQPITDRIGCPSGRTIKECNGDILFKAPDGIRTISGTFNIGDTEIASISRPIQSILFSINDVATPPVALTIHAKTQYRLFYPNLTGTSSPGIIGAVRRFRDGHEGWEWGQLQGIAAACCDSGYLADTNEYVIHGGFDGFVYRQEQGNTFNGAAINEVYTTVPLELGDIGLRKAVKRITVYASTSSSSPNLVMSLIYDYHNLGVIQPNPYILQTVGGGTFVYDSGVKYDNGATYDSTGNSSLRQLVQGSGFTLKIQITSSGPTISPYVIQGYYVEFFPGGRR